MTPETTNELLLQVPLVGVTVTVVVIFGSSLFMALKWFWGQYVSERDKDREWKEKQAEQRDRFTEAMNNKWLSAVNEMAERWEKHIADSEEQEQLTANTLKGAVEAIKQILARLEEHDRRAKRIEANVEKIQRRIDHPTPGT